TVANSNEPQDGDATRAAAGFPELPSARLAARGALGAAVAPARRRRLPSSDRARRAAVPRHRDGRLAGAADSARALRRVGYREDLWQPGGGRADGAGPRRK